RAAGRRRLPLRRTQASCPGSGPGQALPAARYRRAARDRKIASGRIGARPLPLTSKPWFEGAPAKDVLARMTGTCGSLVRAVGIFLHRTDEQKLARAINATRRSAGQGTKPFPKLAEGAGTCSPAS